MRTVEVMIGSVAAFLLAYFALVRTSFGQRMENDALPEISLQHSWLGYLDIIVVVVAVLVVVLGRRKCLPALGVLGGSVVLSQVLKSALDRPELDFGAMARHNSFPSGHVTAAVACVVALAMVLPRRFVWLTLPMAVFPALVAAETVTLGWHRFSDALGAALLVATLCGLALRAWTKAFLVPIAVSAFGTYLMAFSSVETRWLAGACVFAIACYCVGVVRAHDPNASGSVEVGRDDRRDGVESGIRSVPVGGQHHLVTVHCPERHESEHARGFHGVAAVLSDGDLHRLVGGGLRQQCGRPGVQPDLAGHGDPSLRHDPSSSR
ncbi:hypothetical protein Lesp02_82800 [Lentzea sp. NBRC 105346]|nr:hypothetical protein Lesp02_82800 [Lentzea sp. NBRC 105346]